VESGLRGERERKGPVIAISGSPGSGKTTYARYLSEKLGLRFVSGGTVFRQMARERGVSLLELNKLASIDYRIDVELERRLLEEALKGGVVIESHLAGWTLRSIADVSIYVKASLKSRIERIARREGREWDDVVVETCWRETLETQRFFDLYSVDLTDLRHFDVVLDTTYLSEAEAKETLLNIALKLLKSRGFRVDAPYGQSSNFSTL